MDGITRRHGHYLPHWSADGATYFVTFRLADSMPRSVVQGFLEEFEHLVAVEEQALNRKLNSAEIAQAKLRLRNKLERFLDSGYGACHLKRPECAAIVRDSLAFFDSDRYLLGAWAIMPNHVHAILKPSEGHELDRIVRSWKRFTSREINKVIGKSGRLWQSEPFDHMIRNGDHFLRFSRYVLENPLKAGLTSWDWVGVGSLGSDEDSYNPELRA